MAPREAIQVKATCESPAVAVRPPGVAGGKPLTNPAAKDCQAPIVVLLAISALVPPLSAVTYLPLFMARRAILPLPASNSVNVSQLPTAVLLAINGDAPPFSAVTYLPLTAASSAILPPPASTT